MLVIKNKYMKLLIQQERQVQGERDFDVTALILASNLPSLAWLMYPENGINISIYLYLLRW